MFSAVVVAGLEMFLTTRGAGHSHAHGGSWEAVPDREGRQTHINGAANSAKKPLGRLGKLGLSRRPRDLALEDIGASEGLVEGASPLPVSTPTPTSQPRDRDDHQIDDDDDSDLDLNELEPTAAPFTRSHTDMETAPPTTESGPSRVEQQKRQMLQCILLEAGILFHSVFIGMAVSVATGTPFVVFLVAISFHQSFEGLALGSRIAAIDFPRHSPKPWLMVLAYGATTPIGQAIGLFLHKLYDPQSAAGLLMVGFMNAISSGLLLFSGLVQLLAEDFLSEKSYGILRGRRRVEAFSAVLAGASLMAFVGVWA
ncbi:zip family zinc transporter [Diplocarpon rosae]|nr:zip family zinc transporter [Diplocarpon rosae]